MDVMSFSYSACETLAEIARLQSRGADAARWSLQATRVRDKLVDYLWDDARGACFDRDKNHRPQSVLTHQYAALHVLEQPARPRWRPAL